MLTLILGASIALTRVATQVSSGRHLFRARLLMEHTVESDSVLSGWQPGIGHEFAWAISSHLDWLYLY